jgi:hypothetical protein
MGIRLALYSTFPLSPSPSPAGGEGSRLACNYKSTLQIVNS